MNKLRHLLLLAACAACATATAGDATAGKATATVCIACHGEGGANPIANYPILAGQHENYLLHSMHSYQDGTRSNAIMIQQLAELNNTELANLAAYFATQPSPLK